MNKPQSTLAIARKAHEAWQSALQNGRTWEEAPEYEQRLVILAITFIRLNPEAPPRNLHYFWFGELLATGWSFGPEEDVENRRHPLCAPYEAIVTEGYESALQNLIDTIKKELDTTTEETKG